MTRLQKSLMAGTSSLALALALAPAPARADCPGVIVNGETQTSSRTLLNGEDCVIEAGGAIETSANGAEGIVATAGNNTISNSGSIATTGNSSEGIYAFSNNNTISNSGSITTTSTFSEGIQTLDNNIISNSGSISGGNTNSDGIAARDNNTISNSGSITTTGDFAYGIQANLNNTITSSGSIATTGTGSRGIYAVNNNTITSSGSITTTGANADGIYASDNNTITNSRSITTTGTNAEGIDVNDNNTVSNSGLISATGAGSSAINFRGNNSALILNPGAVIIGPINFVNATNTLSVGNGLSIANTFTGNLPANINANGAPFAVNGLQVAVVDPTNLSAQDEALADLTGGISSAVLNRLGGVRNGVAGVTSNPRPMPVGSKDGGDAGERARQYWMQGFGAKRDQDGDGPSGDTDLQLAGFVSGMDAQVSNLTRAGFFLGGSFSEVSAEFNSQDTEIDSFFGGVYASTLRGRTAIDMAVTVGYSDYDRERMVANNLAATGLQTARADYDGWFVSPEITLTRPFWPMGKRIEQSVTLRYAGMFLDGFTETGAAAPLTVQDRDVHVGQARAQLAVPLTHEANNGAYSRLMLKGGAQVRTQFGDRDISGTLLAQNINFNPGGERTATGGFVGLSAEHVTPGGLAFQATVEGLFEDDGSQQVSGKVGVKFRF